MRMFSCPGSQIEMVGVAENDLGAQFFEDVLGNGLHRRDGADGHEDRRFDLAMRRDDASGASAAIASFDGEGEGHCSILPKARFTTAARRTK